MNPIDFGLWGERSSSIFALCIKPCGHNTDYRFCLITFKLHMSVVDDECRNPFDLWLCGQRSRSAVKPCKHDKDNRFLPNHFQSLNVRCRR